MFGVDIPDLNLGIQINPVTQTNPEQLFGFETHVSLMDAFDSHLNHCFIVLKDVQHSTRSRKLHVQSQTVNILRIRIVVLGWNLGLVLGVLA